jgi:Tfp pilus assembly protein PilF
MISKYMAAILGLTLACAACGAAPLHSAGVSNESDDRLTSEQLLEVAAELARRGDAQRAEQYLVHALDQGADEKIVFPALLSVYIGDHQYRLAAQRCEHYLRQHPDRRDLRILLAALYETVGEYDNAVREYERVLRADPNHARTHFALASVLQEQTPNQNAASTHYRRYLQLEPKGEHAALAKAALDGGYVR